MTRPGTAPMGWVPGALPLLAGAWGTGGWLAGGLLALAIAAATLALMRRRMPPDPRAEAVREPSPHGEGSWTKDEITGLPTVSFLQEKLPAAQGAGETTGPLTLLTIHIAGLGDPSSAAPGLSRERALLEVADTVRSILRSGDTCVRGKADDLMAVLPGLDPETSGALVTRVKHAVQSLTLITHTGGEMRLDVAVGRAFMPRDGDNMDALLEAAHQDMERTRPSQTPPGSSARDRLARAAPFVSN